jgi:hypothetical protein
MILITRSIWNQVTRKYEDRPHTSWLRDQNDQCYSVMGMTLMLSTPISKEGYPFM